MPPSASKQPKVAIIGAGLAGLVSAKSCAEAGLFPVVFDRRSRIAGMWGDDAAFYTTLQTNVSRHACAFSDFPWPPGTPDFPSAAAMGEYLAAYAKAFLDEGGNCRMQLSSEVLLVERPSPPSSQWRVDYRTASHNSGTSTGGGSSEQALANSASAAAGGGADSNGDGAVRSELFDAVIVATGANAQPHTPHIPGAETFPGLLLHSARYRSPASVAGRARVAVIGGGNSAVDIAADLASAVGSPGGPTQVLHVIPRSFWVVSRYLPSDATSPAPVFMPLDLTLYRRAPRKEDAERLFPTAEHRKAVNNYFRSLCGDQAARFGPCLEVPPDTTEPPALGISNSYGAMLTCGSLQLRRGRLVRFHGSTLELSTDAGGGCNSNGDGGSGSGGGGSGGGGGSLLLEDVDAVVLATGLKPSLSFLPPDLLQELSYTPDDNYIPLALHRGVFAPSIPGLAFVGLWRGPYFTPTELQARLAAAVFSGALPYDDAAVQRDSVATEIRIREQRPRPFLPHADYVGHVDSLARALHVLPPPESRADPAYDHVIAAQFAVVPPPPSPLLAAEAAAERAAAAAAAAAGALEELSAAVRAHREGRGVAAAVFQSLHGEWELRRTIVSRMDSSPSGVVRGRASFTPTAPPAAAAAAADAAAAGGPGSGGAAGGGLPYLYAEQGQFITDRGAVMRVRREYEYEYDRTADRLDVYFREGAARGAFFHSLRFLPPQAPKTAAAQGAVASGVTSSSTAADGGGSSSTGPGSTSVSGASAAAPAAAEAAAAGSGAAGGWRAVGEHLCIRDMYRSSYRFEFQGLWLREFEIQFDVKGPNKDYTAVATYRRPEPGAQAAPGDWA
ncbi:hypothetical protein HYH03_002854 [Edaphochlamys debaryana]|uniref:Flavin-containing monooxygenase n=1 Tax=Edaphochlamys debaryana TaxID=47281 RepID=A0A835YAY2_9CHLO|nr:hypothetical protein HYH03_002854 [Edaphochlamys debaryana]|eukprot:KAG2499276.1 hypothetical protein HYH03_002854 [Edaphochlamys debaryana]